MPGLVAQYPVAPFTTPINGDDLDAALVVSHDSSIASAHTSHDADPSIHFQSSTLAARPGAGIVGRKWITSDGLRVYFDTGAVWSEIDYLCKTTGGVVAGATTFSAGIVSTTGAFSGAVSMAGLTATTGAFSGAVSMTALTATTGAFSGTVTIGAGPTQKSIAAAGDITVGANDAVSIGSDAARLFQVFANRFGTTSGAVTMTGTSLSFTGASTFSSRIAGLDIADVASGNPEYGGALTLKRGTPGDFIASFTSYAATGKGLRVYTAGGATGRTALEITTSFGISFLVDGNGIVCAGTPTSVVGAGLGDIVLPNVKSIRGANAAGTASRALIQLSAADKVAIDTDALGTTFGAGAVFAGALSGITTLVTTGRITSGSDLIAANPGFIGWGGRSIFQSPSDGVVLVTDNAGATFARLQFGGTSAAFPSWKRSGTTLAARLADDSGDAPVTMAGLTATTGTFGGAVSGVTTLAMGGALSGATTIAASSSVDVGVAHVKAGATTAVGVGSATTIYTAVNSGGYAVVFGSSGGRVFCDTITWDTATAQIFAISSTVIAGIPSGRTYSLSGSNIQLTMAASGTSAKLLPIEFN